MDIQRLSDGNTRLTAVKNLRFKAHGALFTLEL